MKFDKEVDLAEGQETVHRLIVVVPGKSPSSLNYNIAQEKKIVKNINARNRRITMTYKLYDPSLEKISGQVICVLDGVETEYQSVQELTARVFDKKYLVSEISSRGDKTVVVLKENDIVPNDLTADWAQKQMAETGREISFF